MGDTSPAIHLEPITLTGRVYLKGGSPEQLTPFDAVFTVQLLGGGKAKATAAHGTFNRRVYGLIARQLREQYGITDCDMSRHGKPITVGTDRGGKIGVLP